MTATQTATAGVLEGLNLPILRARVTMRLLEGTTLPPYKGGLLRGGFGYAFQRAACPPRCWGESHNCGVDALCPYRWIFETPHPPGMIDLHDLQDVPRPFVIEPPLDQKRAYAAGDTLEFGLLILGRAIDHLPYFLFSFEQLGVMGLGRDRTRARLERVEALELWLPVGRVVYQDGHARTDRDWLPLLQAPAIAEQAARLPGDLRLTLPTPLRVKARGSFIEALDLPALVQAASWRLNALATFHGGGPWACDHRALAEQARGVTVESTRVQWVDWERTSTRAPEPRIMKLGGLVGVATLRGVPADLRALLLAGSLAHVGKAAVFGHGKIELAPIANGRNQ